MSVRNLLHSSHPRKTALKIAPRGEHITRYTRERSSPLTQYCNHPLLDALGPSWALMTPRQRRLYPDLPADEKDMLWGAGR